MEEFRKKMEEIKDVHKEEDEEKAKKRVMAFLEAAKAFARRC